MVSPKNTKLIIWESTLTSLAGPLPLPPPVSMDYTGIENFPFYYIPFLIVSSLDKRHFLFLRSNLVTHVVTSYDSREKAFSALEWYEIN